MKSGLITKIEEAYMLVMVDDMTVEKLQLREGAEVGQRIEYGPKDIYKGYTQFNYRRAGTFVAFALVIMITGLVVFNNASPGVHATVSVDVNPSLNIQIDENGLVIDVTAFTPEGEALLDKDYRKKSIEEVLTTILAKAKSNGTLREDQRVLIAVVRYGDSETISKRLRGYIEVNKDDYRFAYIETALDAYEGDSDRSAARTYLKDYGFENAKEQVDSILEKISGYKELNPDAPAIIEQDVDRLFIRTLLPQSEPGAEPTAATETTAEKATEAVETTTAVNTEGDITIAETSDETVSTTAEEKTTTESNTTKAPQKTTAATTAAATVPQSTTAAVDYAALEAEAARLEKEINDRETVIAGLLEELEELPDAIEKAERDRDDQEDELNETQAVLDGKKVERDQAYEEAEDAYNREIGASSNYGPNEVEVLKEQYEEAEAAYQAALTDYNNAMAAYNEAKEEHAQAQSNYNTADANYDAATAAYEKDPTEDNQEAMIKARDQRAAAEDELAEADNALEAATSEIYLKEQQKDLALYNRDSVKQAYEDAVARKEAFFETYKALAAEVTALEKDVDMLFNKFSELNTAALTLKKDLEKKQSSVDELKGQVADLKEQLAKVQEQLAQQP